MGEFETRLEMAHRAQSAEQLRLILADLPPAPVPEGNDCGDNEHVRGDVSSTRPSVGVDDSTYSTSG